MSNRSVSALDRVRVWHFAILFMLSFLSGAVAIAAIERTLHVDVPTSLTGAVVISAAVVGWVGWAALGQGLNLRALFNRPPSNLSGCAATAFAIIGVYMLGKAEMHVLVPILEKSAPSWADWYTLSTIQPAQGHRDLLLRGVQLLLIAPLFEEVVFRGMIFQRWAYAWKKPFWAVIAASALFSTVHGHILSSFVFAVTATMLYLYTRSLWAPIAMHLVLNGISFAGILPLETGFDMLTGISRTWILGLAYVILSITILLLFFWYYGDSLENTLPYNYNNIRERNSDPRIPSPLVKTG